MPYPIDQLTPNPLYAVMDDCLLSAGYTFVPRHHGSSGSWPHDYLYQVVGELAPSPAQEACKALFLAIEAIGNAEDDGPQPQGFDWPIRAEDW
jgi:hypothetical protein